MFHKILEIKIPEIKGNGLLEQTILEQFPTKRSIIIDDKIYCLSFPYLIFNVRQYLDDNSIESLWVYCSNCPIDTKNLFSNYISQLPLPNMSSSGRVCLNNIIHLSPTIEEIINYFWMSEFDSNSLGESWKKFKYEWLSNNPLKIKWDNFRLWNGIFISNNKRNIKLFPKEEQCQSK